jgi:DNA-binding beta-propeller fold protein YncE
LSRSYLHTLLFFTGLVPTALAVRAAPYVFLAGAGSTISIFDAQSLGETGSIPYPGPALNTVFSPDGSKAYVTTGTIFITSPATHRITGTLLSHGAQTLRISGDGSRLFAANSDRSIWVYDLATSAVIAKIPYLVHDASYYSATDLAISADGSLIVLSTIENNCGEFGCPPGDPFALVTEIDGKTYKMIRRIQPSNATGVAISPDNQTIYVAAGGNIQKFATSNGALLGSIAVGANVLLTNGSAGRLYAGSGSATGQVSAITIATDQIVGQADTPYPVSALGLSPDGSTLFAGGCGLTANVQLYPCAATVISTAAMQAGSNVTLFGFPGSLAVSPSGTELWASNTTPTQVTVIGASGNRVIGGAEADFSPYSLAVTPSGSKVYASSPVSGSISVIDGHTFDRRAILSAASTFNVVGENAASPDGDRVYMILNAVRVIDTSTDQIVGTIQDEPQSVAVSNDSQTVFTLDLFPSTSINAYSASSLQKLYGGRVVNDIATRLLISPGNNRLFVIADISIQFVNPQPIQVVKRINQGCLDAVLSPDGSLLYCLAPAPSTGAIVNVLAYETATGALTRTYSTTLFSPSGSIAITPDGASLFVSLQTPTASKPGGLEKIDVVTGTITFADTHLYGQISIQ